MIARTTGCPVPVLAAAALDLPRETFELIQVRLADRTRVGGHLSERLEAAVATVRASGSPLMWF